MVKSKCMCLYYITICKPGLKLEMGVEYETKTLKYNKMSISGKCIDPQLYGGNFRLHWPTECFVVEHSPNNFLCVIEFKGSNSECQISVMYIHKSGNDKTGDFRCQSLSSL